MSHPIDASVKHLVTERLADWLPLSGRAATGPLEVIDADLSTVTAYADKVRRVGGDPHGDHAAQGEAADRRPLLAETVETMARAIVATAAAIPEQASPGFRLHHRQNRW